GKQKQTERQVYRPLVSLQHESPHIRAGSSHTRQHDRHGKHLLCISRLGEPLSPAARLCPTVTAGRCARNPGAITDVHEHHTEPGSRGVSQRFSVRFDRHKGLTWEWMGARGLRHASAALPRPGAARQRAKITREPSSRLRLGAETLAKEENTWNMLLVLLGQELSVFLGQELSVLLGQELSVLLGQVLLLWSVTYWVKGEHSLYPVILKLWGPPHRWGVEAYHAQYTEARCSALRAALSAALFRVWLEPASHFPLPVPRPTPLCAALSEVLSAVL
ncbi:unnamed protein product, partial [Pleuronectes platessa]